MFRDDRTLPSDPPTEPPQDDPDDREADRFRSVEWLLDHPSAEDRDSRSFSRYRRGLGQGRAGLLRPFPILAGVTLAVILFAAFLALPGMPSALFGARVTPPAPAAVKTAEVAKPPAPAPALAPEAA